MRWLKFIGIASIVLCLFAGGIVFDIFVVQYFTHKKTLESAQNNQTQITQDIQVTQAIKPDLVQMEMSVTESNMLYNTPTLAEKQRESIMQKLNAIIKLTQTHKNICKYNPYAFGPRSYDRLADTSNRGYMVNLHINCKMQEADSKDYEEFVAQLKKIVYEDEWLDFSIRAFELLASDSLQTAQEKILRKLAIQQAHTLTTEYDQNLNMQCAIASLSFGQNARKYYASSVATTMQNSQQTLDSNINVKALITEATEIIMPMNAQLHIVCKP